MIHRWVPWLVLPLLALLLVGLHVRAYHPLSPIDEFQHADALYRAGQVGVVRSGDRIGPYTLERAACRGIDQSQVPPCGSGRGPEEFPGAGYNTADIHSPLYYLVTAALSAPLRLAGIDLIDAGRLVGAAWLGAGLILIWVLGGRLGAGGPARWGACILAASSLNVLEPSATVNVDATALAAGGLAALAALEAESRRWPAWTLAAAGAGAGLLKVHHLLGALVAGGYSLGRGRLAQAALMVGAAAAGQAGWLVARRMLSSVSLADVPILKAEHADRLGPGQVLGQLGALMTPVAAPYTPALLQHPLVALMTNLQNLVLIAAVLGGAFYLARGTRAHALALSTAAVMLAGGPLLVVATFVARHSFVPAFPRYGLSTLPVAFALLAAAARGRLAAGGLLALAGASLALDLYYLARAGS